MTCWNCEKDTPLSKWGVVIVKCASSSCSEDNGRQCPNCLAQSGHTWLDGQQEWRDSEFYKS